MTQSVLALGAVAGEKSGDLLAAGVLAALADAQCGLDARGIGGPSMAAAGFERWWDIEALSVNGYTEVLREYPRLRRMREDLKRHLVDWRRSEEHTSELQSRENLVCRLLLEKKKIII